MARYTLMLKAYEDDHRVVYRFGPDEEHLGILELDKLTRHIREVQPVPGHQVEAHLRQAARKCYKLVAHQTPFPERTSYAA